MLFKKLFSKFFYKRYKPQASGIESFLPLLVEKYRSQDETLLSYVGKDKTTICKMFPSYELFPEEENPNISRSFIKYREMNAIHIFVMDYGICSTVISIPEWTTL